MSKFHKRVDIVACVLFAAGLASPAYAQEAKNVGPFPLKAETDQRVLLGGWLETRFQKMVASCTNTAAGAIQLKARAWLSWEDEKPVSVIPMQVQTFYALNRDTKAPPGPSKVSSVYSLGSQTLNSLFSLVETSDRPKTTIDGELTPAKPGIASLSLASLPADINPPLAQFNGAGYSMSCANAFSFAYKFDAKYEVLPTGSIGAALDGGASSNSKNNLRLNAGVFYSPFVAMWTGQYTTYNSASLSPIGTQAYGADETAALKTLAGAIFWEWYVANPAKADAGNYIVEYFSGVATVEEQTASSIDTANAQTSASLTVPVVSASLKASYENRKETSFWSRTFDLAAYRDGGSAHPGSNYVRIPPPAAIAEALKTIVLKPSSLEPIALSTSGPTEFYQDAYGILPTACNWGWTLRKDSSPAAGGLSLSSAQPEKDAAGVTVCRFKLSYQPTPEVQTQGAEIDFDVASVRQIPTKAGPVSFGLKGTRVKVRPMTTGSWKRLTLGPQAPVDETGQPLTASSKKAVWRFDFQFDPGESGMATPTFWILENKTVTCDGAKPTIAAITPVYGSSNDPNFGLVLTIRFETGIPTGTPLVAIGDAAQCKVSGSLRYSPPGAAPLFDKQAVAALPLIYPFFAK